MKEVFIHNKKYIVNQCEFETATNLDLDPMVVKTNVSFCDRDIGMLKKLSSTLGLNEIFCSEVEFGGYIPINLVDIFPTINISCQKISVENIRQNIRFYNLENRINIIRYTSKDEYELSVENEIGIIISKVDTEKQGMRKLSYFEKFIYVSNLIWTEFSNKFRYWLQEDSSGVFKFTYDNLINLLIMVKDAGDQFRDILERNKPYIDRWTILDTGSTDNTISIINEVLADKEGTLYQEPFINFRDSRNRLLELAGSDCAFNLMLDDTYYVTGSLRDFLAIARGDDIADSFSVFISDPECEYSSNRITKSQRGLRYKYKVHEIIEENKNLCIPINIVKIIDVISPYMRERTMTRKEKDLELLFEDLNEMPDDPRSLYYIAETYYCMGDWTNAFKYYKLRTESENKGFNEEIYDSYFKIGLISERFLNSPWEECEEMYLNCYRYDTDIPDPLFMIGYHYLNSGNNKLAYNFLKRVMMVQKVHKNMNVRTIITSEYAPRFLLPLCLDFKDYELGLKCASILVNNFKDNFTYRKWLSIFSLNNKLETESSLDISTLPKLKSDQKLICFIDNGGWDSWDGETLTTKGLGGSETWTVQYAETLALNQNNKIIVFCNCGDTEKVHKNVTYIPIEKFIRFGLDNVIDVCLVSRFSEYLFLCIQNQFTIQKLYYVLHDLAIEGDIVPVTDKLTGILCISEWQKEQFLRVFPSFKNKIHIISYGIETSEYSNLENKKKYSFIYPSFPNRGLLYLLKMFPKIVERYPDAKLNVFCNLDLAYLHYAKEEIDEIRSLLDQQSTTVTNHGWVNRETLNQYWSESHIWFYPCTFAETCCRVAMEASASKTFAICNDLGALTETVGSRGAIIPGDPKTEEWQSNALTNLFFTLDHQLENIFIEKNYSWAKTKSYSSVVADFETRFLTIENEAKIDNVVPQVEEITESYFESEDPTLKLKYIHSKLNLEYGSFQEEYNEQIMNCKFIKGTENVLEIGGNIGRNSLVIAYILNRNNNSNLVTLESNPQFAKQLEHNRNSNDLNFHIEESALSKRKLIQGENNWETIISPTVPSGYISVNTITWEKLCEKYPFTFDTLVLDCEGAFYYILKDMPEILTNIKMILMENNYHDRSHKQYIDSILEQNGFGIAYSEPGNDVRNSLLSCREMFYQVWIKGYQNNTIPMDIFQICIHNYQKIPEKVFDNISRSTYGRYTYTLNTGPMVSKIVDKFDQDYKRKYDSCLKFQHKKDMLQMVMLYASGGVYVDIDFEPLTSFDNILKRNELNPTFVGVLGVNRNDGLNICLMACTKYNKIISLILHHFYMLNFEEHVNGDYGLMCRIVGFALKKFMGVDQLEEGFYRINGERILLLNEIWNEGDYSSCKIVCNEEVLGNSRYVDYPWDLNEK